MILAIEYLHGRDIIYREYVCHNSVSNLKTYSLTSKDISDSLISGCPKWTLLKAMLFQSVELRNIWRLKSYTSKAMVNLLTGGVWDL